MGTFVGNIEKITNENNFYRKVINTTPQQQLVVMSLRPGTEIGSEIHPYTTQFIRIESGSGFAMIENKKISLNPDDVIVIPPGMMHNIINDSLKTDLKLYTIYSPPEHEDQLIQKIRPLTH
jgi:mannose-6-phosphate isomerase-like protein (cupin superfamily)